MSKSERITVRLTLQQKKSLWKEAKRIGVSMGWILRESYFNNNCMTKEDNSEDTAKHAIPHEETISLQALNPPPSPPSQLIKSPPQANPPELLIKKNVSGYKDVLEELVEKLALRKKSKPHLINEIAGISYINDAVET